MRALNSRETEPVGDGRAGRVIETPRLLPVWFAVNTDVADGDGPRGRFRFSSRSEHRNNTNFIYFTWRDCFRSSPKSQENAYLLNGTLYRSFEYYCGEKYASNGLNLLHLFISGIFDFRDAGR